MKGSLVLGCEISLHPLYNSVHRETFLAVLCLLLWVWSPSYDAFKATASREWWKNEGNPGASSTNHFQMWLRWLLFSGATWSHFIFPAVSVACCTVYIHSRLRTSMSDWSKTSPNIGTVKLNLRSFHSCPERRHGRPEAFLFGQRPYNACPGRCTTACRDDVWRQNAKAVSGWHKLKEKPNFLWVLEALLCFGSILYGFFHR